MCSGVPVLVLSCSRSTSGSWHSRANYRPTAANVQDEASDPILGRSAGALAESGAENVGGTSRDIEGQPEYPHTLLCLCFSLPRSSSTEQTLVHSVPSRCDTQLATCFA